MRDGVIEEARIARVLNAAQILCMAQGSAGFDEVASASTLDRATVRHALLLLTQRGDLMVRPGGRYARGLARQLRLPGESYSTELVRNPVTALMGAR